MPKLVVLYPINHTDRHGDERKLLPGDLVDDDDPLVALHPVHFGEPPAEESPVEVPVTDPDAEEAEAEEPSSSSEAPEFPAESDETSAPKRGKK